MFSSGSYTNTYAMSNHNPTAVLVHENGCLRGAPIQENDAYYLIEWNFLINHEWD